MKVKETSDDSEIQQTVGYNLINFYYNYTSYDIWELGGDPVSRSYWPTFYRNLKIDIIVFMISLYETKTHNEALKELLILANEEELKGSKIVILFNCNSKEKSKSNNNEDDQEEKETAGSILSVLRDASVHDYDNRVTSCVFDLSKMRDGENKTLDLQKDIFSIQDKNVNK